MTWMKKKIMEKSVIIEFRNKLNIVIIFYVDILGKVNIVPILGGSTSNYHLLSKNKIKKQQRVLNNWIVKV